MIATTPDGTASLDRIAADLEAGRVTAVDLVEACLARIEDEQGEGRRTFVAVNATARDAAAGWDRLRATGDAPSRFAGIPIAIKDLFDVRGEVTRAGSRVLPDQPAGADAPVIRRLRQAGFVLLGRTSMTEFAYSGLGLNPHDGTPRSPWDRDTGRVPGGSSSGSAVAVADGMACAALGTDTGGSCRIPAAFNGIVGYKPTQRRVPLAGAYPLAASLDSIGPIARTVSCCATLDAILAGEEPEHRPARPVRGLRIAVPTSVALDGLDDTVSAAFERALARLGDAGATIERIAVPEFLDVATINAKGGLSAAEAYWLHRERLATVAERYDPRVAIRILRGQSITAADYLDMLAARAALIAGVWARLSPYDVVAMPTVATVAPRIADLADDAAYGATNLLVLRNCTLVNMADGCAISLPIHRAGEAPVGLMLAAAPMADAALFAAASGIEDALAPSRA